MATGPGQCCNMRDEEPQMMWRSWSAGDWLMAGAVALFIVAGVAKLFERQGRLGVALILLGLANGILLTLSRR